MDISRDKAAGTEGETSIRLRYSRQFQSGGHAHTIDAETTLSVGAGPERREQVIRELEIGVEQLARQIIQHSSRSTSETRTHAPGPSGQTISRGTEPASLPAQKPANNPPPPATRVPVSETMPATPAASNEGNTVRLPQFINAIKKRWDMSLKEAMDLLNVATLDGANLRDVYGQLQTIMESRNTHPARPNPQARTTQTMPVVEAPRQTGRSMPSSPTSRPLTNQATMTPPVSATRGSGNAAFKESARPAPPTAPIPASPPDPKITSNQPYEPASVPDFAGSPKSKAPLPIQLGVVRDIVPRTYQFEEEEDEETYEQSDGNEMIHQKAQVKLDRLKGIRGSSVTSAERLGVLNNIVSSQISEEQLERLIEGVWGLTTKKKLKAHQVEELISWAKEDDFVDEIEAVLALIEEGEE